MGNPCDEDRECPAPLACIDHHCLSADQTGAVGPDGSVGGAMDAVIDVGTVSTTDDADPGCGGQPCEPNDLPAGAIDITGGGTFHGDLLRAHDDLANNGCNLDGGAEVFYQVELAAPEVYYFDTFATTFDTSLRVFPGVACADVTAAMQPVCDDDECGTDQSQLAVPLPMGPSCLAVDKNLNLGHQADQGGFELLVVPGKRTGIALPIGVQKLSGNTCNATKVFDPPATCNGDRSAPDVAYFFTACPNKPATIDASTCGDVTKTTFDTMLYVRSAAGDDRGCIDDSSACPVRPTRPNDPPDGSILSVTVHAAGLYWLVIDGFDTSCGGYQLDTTLH